MYGLNLSELHFAFQHFSEVGGKNRFRTLKAFCCNGRVEMDNDLKLLSIFKLCRTPQILFNRLCYQLIVEIDLNEY